MMKANRYSRIARAILLITAGVALWGGCTKDRVVGETSPLPAGNVTLNISLPAPVPQSMNTRAGVGDFNVLDDLNVVIARGGADTDGILKIEHFANLATSVGDPDQDEVAYTSNGDGTYSIHFSETWLQRWEATDESVFFLVGNYGEEITGVSTVKELRELQDGPYGTPGLVGSLHLMFAQAEPVEGNNHGHDEGISLKAELTRTAAMITVVIDGSGLNSNVIIVPQSISLHNVPTWSYLGKYNVVTDNVVADGESISAANLGWGPVVGESMTAVQIGDHVVGAHYTDGEFTNPGTPGSPSPSNITPLFMFENYHGPGFGEEETDQRFKRPDGVARNATAIADAPETATCSYLQVRAQYRKVNASGQVTMGGDVSFRVFLGGNVTDNFDVMRNTCYQFTLTLSGNAVTEGGDIGSNGELQPNPAQATWRVTTDLNNQTLLSESDFILNGGGEMIFIEELLHEPDNSGMKVWYHYGQTQQGANVPYLYMVTQDGWQPFPLASNQYVGSNSTKFGILNSDGLMQFRLYVNPMRPSDGDGYVRRVTFNIGTNSGNYIGDTITITQYAPIVIELNESNTSAFPEIQGYVKMLLNTTDFPDLTIYLDRIDRDGMPWGFDGVSIPANDNSGFDNGIALLNNASANPGQYLPFGKSNSAMMHAAFMNYYQYLTSPEGFTASQNPPNPTIEAIAAVEDLPGDLDVPNSIPSRAEWKLLEMLDKAGFEVFDSSQPVEPWFNYWTSDAVVGNSTRSYVYRMGQGLDQTEDDLTDYPSQFAADRTTPVRYRMVRLAY